MTAPPTVLIVEGDHNVAAVVSDVAASLGFESALFATSEAFHQAPSYPEVGCAVIDMHLPGTEVRAVQDSLCRGAIAIPLIYSTVQPVISDIVRRMRDGALTVLEKPLEADVLMAELQEAIALSKDRHQVATQRNKLLARLATLTPRECEVLALVRLGKTSREIAAIIERTTKTVELHRTNILRKLGVRNVVALVRDLTALDVCSASNGERWP